MTDARTGLAGAGALHELGDGLLDVAGGEVLAEGPPARLLPAFDPYLLGWRDRGWVVPEPYRRAVHPGGGTLRAVAVHRGLAVGIWTARRTGERLRVEVNPFGELDADLTTALRHEAEDVARFEGRTLSQPP